MAKKRRRLGSGVHAPGAEPAAAAVAAGEAAVDRKAHGGGGGHSGAPPAGAPPATATSPAANGAAPAGAPPANGAGPAAAGGTAAGEGFDAKEVELALRAIHKLCALKFGAPRGEEREGEAALTEAVRPLILARASKYEEDTRAAKLAEAAAGNPANARAGIGGPGGGKKRQASAGPAARREAAAGGADGESVASLRKEETGDAVRALSALGQRPAALLSKALKPLRSALHPLVEAHLREEKASPAFRVTCALGQRSRWPEALRLLADMRKLDPPRRPKLGAYQRWVREVDAAHGDPQELAMLDAIMRVAAGFPASTAPAPSEGALAQMAPWQAEDVGAAAGAATGEAVGPAEATPAPANDVAPDGETGTGATPSSSSTASKLTALIAARRGEVATARAAAAASFAPGSWSVVAHEAGHERQPPNRFDLDICTCAAGVLPLAGPPAASCERRPVPGVEGAFVLSSVLSPAECDAVRGLTEAIGYRPDVPLSSALDERAHNVVLFANDVQHEALFNRVKDLLPQEVGGDKLLGLNRRWRVYRYLQGNAYRKHLDGAWPASGIRVLPDGRKEYLYDAYGGSTRSRYTFIIYLNDDFEGGCTTFFVPQPGVEGTLEARPVRPRTGYATVFPHGETGVPLLHEGSPVLSGIKYLLRTDVVYASPEDSAAVKEAKRLRGLARQLGGLGGASLAEEVDATHGAAKPAVAGVPRKAGDTTGKRRVIKTGLKKSRFQEKLEAKKAKGKPGGPAGDKDGGAGAGAGAAAARGRKPGKAGKPLAHQKLSGGKRSKGGGRRLR